MNEKQTMRDVLMAFGEAVRDAVWKESGEGWNGEYPDNAMPKVDIAALVDSYTSQITPEQKDSNAINQQMLAAAKELIAAYQADGGPSRGHIYKGPTREWERRTRNAWVALHEAIASAAEAAQSCQHCKGNGFEFSDKDTGRTVLANCPACLTQPASSQPVAQQAEPVAWQCRAVSPSGLVHSDWKDCSEREVKRIQENPTNGLLRYEVRELYAHPPAVAVQDNLLARLEHHMRDKENTAFARSTMRELYDLLSAAKKSEGGE